MAAVTEPTKVIFGRNVTLRRRQLRITQEQLADDIGVRRNHMSDYEHGKHGTPGEERLRRFAAALKCDPWWLTTPHPEEWRAWDID